MTKKKCEEKEIKNNKINVLAIAYGRHMFTAGHMERVRMEACAAEVGEYHMIIFTRHTEGHVTTEGKNGLILHPTNAKNNIGQLWAAYRIGREILKNNRTGKWVITAQDPFETALIGLWLRRAFGVPLNIQEHSDIFSLPHWRREKILNRIRYYFGLWALRQADSVRVVAQRILSTLIQKRVSSDRLIKLPVRSDAIIQEINKIKWPDSVPSGAVVVLSMARFCDQKNLSMLIGAFYRMQKQLPHAHLVLIGRGERESVLRTQVNQLGIAQSVTFISWTEEPLSYMTAADIYALSSNYEGWARVLIEAMAVGTPVVTTDVGCAGEILLNNEHGFVVPVGDKDAFAEALVVLGKDRQMRQRFGLAAKSAVSSVHIPLNMYARQWANVLVSTLQAR